MRHLMAELAGAAEGFGSILPFVPTTHQRDSVADWLESHVDALRTLRTARPHGVLVKAVFRGRLISGCGPSRAVGSVDAGQAGQCAGRLEWRKQCNGHGGNSEDHQSGTPLAESAEAIAVADFENGFKTRDTGIAAGRPGR